MTSAYAEQPSESIAAEEVYAPQHDSELLIEAMHRADRHAGRRVADLCTGSGVVAINAAATGADSVTAFDVSMSAVRCARANALAAGVDVDVRHGSWSRAAEFGPFDLVLCNPPYVPEPPGGDIEVIPHHAGPALAFDGGLDGRRVLDPLCAEASRLLAPDGTMLLVHSEFSGVDASLSALREVGLKASVIARQRVPFGPVLMARAWWLEHSGRLERGRRVEELVVVRADVP
jgi:release factor glutamine methyltransferase